MKCRKCGKRLKNNEKFCTICGYYNGEIIEDDWADDKKEEKQEISIKDASGTNEKEFSYENEDLLEAYIGEDYKLIKKMPFNIWAFLLNWMYFLYRKLYITGIIGLGITWIVIVFFRKYFLIYGIITMILLGLIFNKFYIYIAKKRVEKIKEEMEDTDKFTVANTCMEKGGVNIVPALLIYFIFLVIVFFNFVSFRVNKNHNTKFWNENSENKANCNSLIKTAYTNIEEEKRGVAQEAVCKVRKEDSKEYEVYIKTDKEGKVIYSYYATENGYLMYKNNTEKLNDLELKNANNTITEAENKTRKELELITTTYQEIYNKSKSEDKLIETKKNTEEKLNYLFTKEEIIR